MAAQRRRFRWGFAVLGVVVIALLAWVFFHPKAPPPQKPPSVSVTAAKVVVQDMPVSVSGLGAAQAWKSVLINTQVNGMLTYVAAEGTDVAAGDLLAEIQVAPFRAALTQAQGALRRDQALLAGARVDLARFQKLAAQDSIAKQQVDDQAALVKQDEGTVLADQGAVAAAQVNVNDCTIKSPIAGRVGVRLIDPGNIVTTSITTGIVSVNQLTPIAVTFSVPQGDFQKLSEVSGGFSRPLPAEALSQETGASLGMGQLSVADNHVDQQTGTVELKAQFPNGSKTLWPGQFINVRLILQTLQGALTIPAAAVNQGPKGAYVYVIGAGNKVSLRPVTVETTQDTIAVIQSGLKAGELVVTDGQMSLKPGMTVAVHPAAGAAPEGAAPARKPGA
ncbi:efflux RND transporter periplasmic adaptor subunit [Phenylobacterium sp.]|uniref:efflux RND transporter periplasmic adaptor subunit n=1 Tax=Phenylobacterium sp. TaxID=1871053 RepID=UPI002F414853